MMKCEIATPGLVQASPICDFNQIGIEAVITLSNIIG